MPADDIEELDHLSRQTATAVQSLVAEDAAEAEAPEEFMDPIMSEIMINPVTLPSGINIDLETIRHHMMTDSTDPFNRYACRFGPLAGAPGLRCWWCCLSGVGCPTSSKTKAGESLTGTAWLQGCHHGGRSGAKR